MENYKVIKSYSRILNEGFNHYFRKLEESSGKVTLEVTFEPYDPFGSSLGLKTRRASGSDLLDALKRMVDHMLLYLDSEYIEEEGMTAEEVINKIDMSNGDGCDYIVSLINKTTGETLLGSDVYDGYDDWDDDFDEPLRKNESLLTEGLDFHSAKQQFMDEINEDPFGEGTPAADYFSELAYQVDEAEGWFIEPNGYGSYGKYIIQDEEGREVEVDFANFDTNMALCIATSTDDRIFKLKYRQYIKGLFANNKNESFLTEVINIQECPVCHRKFSEGECEKVQRGDESLIKCPKCASYLIKADDAGYNEYTD